MAKFLYKMSNVLKTLIRNKWRHCICFGNGLLAFYLKCRRILLQIQCLLFVSKYIYTHINVSLIKTSNIFFFVKI